MIGIGINCPWTPTKASSGGAVLSLDMLSMSTAPIGTYTRSTPAMQFDSSGVLGWGAHNLLLYSEQFDNAAWAELVTPTVSGNTAVAPDGTTTADTLTPDATNPSARQLTTVVVGTVYTASVYVKAAPTGSATHFRLTSNNASAWNTGASSKVALTSSWQRVEITWTQATTTSARVICGALTVAGALDADCYGNVLIWGAQLNRGTTALTYVPTTSAAVTNLPRPDYDPATLVKRGWLMEGSRTNIATYSGQLDNAAWTKVRCTVTADAAASPSGAADADALMDDATPAATHSIYELLTVTSAATTASVYAKANGRTQLHIALQTGGTYPISYFNLSTGAVVASGAGHTCSVQDVGNGWYRCSVTATTTAGVAEFSFGAAEAGSRTYDGDISKGVYVYGAQLETGSFPSSYIPTTTASASRSADLWTISAAQFLAATGQALPVAEGTLFLEALGANETAFYNRFISMGPSGGGLSPNAVSVYWAGASAQIGCEVKAGNVMQLDIAAASTRANPRFKVAIGWGTTHRAYINGTDLGSPSGTTAISTGLEEIRIGSGNGAYPYTWIRRVIIYPRRLTNSELAALTA